MLPKMICALPPFLRVCLLLLSTQLAPAGTMAQTVPDQALHQAARTNDGELAGFALERGADLGVRDQLGNTPLQVAAMHGTNEFNVRPGSPATLGSSW